MGTTPFKLIIVMNDDLKLVIFSFLSCFIFFQFSYLTSIFLFSFTAAYVEKLSKEANTWTQMEKEDRKKKMADIPELKAKAALCSKYEKQSKEVTVQQHLSRSRFSHN